MFNWTDIHKGFGKKEYDYWGKTYQQLWEKNHLTYQDARKWISIGLKPNDYNFVSYLKQNNITPEQYKNKSPQEQLDYLYANKSSVEWIDLEHLNFNQSSEQSSGDLTQLIIDNYPNLKKITKFWETEISNLTQLTITNCPQLEEIDIAHSKNNQQLILHNLPNLKELCCFHNNLTNLEINNCDNLEKIWCHNNQLTQIKLPRGEKLEWLNLSHNNLNQDLSFLKDLVGLKRLELSSNHFYGSLEFLKDMSKLETLNINNTDIDSGLEYLPESVEYFYCSVNKREDSKVQAIYNLFANEKGEVETDYNGIKNLPQKLQWIKLGFAREERNSWINAGAKVGDAKFVIWLRDIKGYTKQWITSYQADYQVLSERFKKYGLCSECNQLNTDYFFNSKETLCSPCNPSKKAISDFIQKYQSEATKETLEWIPYEQFIDVEYLAKGGFGKVYKAKWNNQEVALKSLNNSQNIETEFLQEVDNHILTSSGSNSQVVKCYGISQNPETKDYIMVMQYIKGGSLRKYLDRNYSKLNFEDKLSQLQNIAEGLSSIHKQELTHRDFHSGNILNYSKIRSYITDLGLSRPVSSESDGIYGVMPYVAPEVLQSQPYTKASDIYSFGIVAYEMLSGLPPYYDREHGLSLGLDICKGLRPEFKIKIPQLLENLIKKCWDSDPSKRPAADKLKKTLIDWKRDVQYKKNTKFTQQLQEAEEHNKTLPDEIKCLDYKKKMHTGAVYHSTLLPTKEITQLLIISPIDIHFLASW